MSSNGSFTQGVNELSLKARKAWFALRGNLQIDFVNNPKIIIKLFDVMIAPILMYGSGVWSQQFLKTMQTVELTNSDNLQYEKIRNQIWESESTPLILGRGLNWAEPQSRCRFSNVLLNTGLN